MLATVFFLPAQNGKKNIVLGKNTFSNQKEAKLGK
jgi:hypothetical protein